MRIGLFTDTYPPFINGVSTSVLMLKKALEKQGHQVYVVTVNNEDLKYRREENGTVLRIPGIPIGIYDYRLTGIYPVRAINTIRKWKLDVIHSHTEFGIGTFARVFAKQFNIPLVHTYHTMYEDYVHYITKGYFNKSSKKIVEYLTMFYCNTTANALIVPTKKTYDLFKEKYDYNKAIHIIPTGIELDRFYLENMNEEMIKKINKQYGFKKNDFIIIFVGRIAQEKNIEFLLDAHLDLVKKHKNIKLVIVGDGPDASRYKEFIKEHSMENNIIMTGKVPYDEMPSYYHLADVFTTASLSETQGLTVIEAMAASLAPICINDECFRNVITNDLDGKIFDDKQGYIDSILDLYEDHKKLEDLSYNARLHSEVHSSKYYAERVVEVYKMTKRDPGTLRRIISKIKYKGDKTDD
ncbi:MAG: glycosyltransferase [Bacilli bacterium]|nr:glycosyltransferase [Bacilli bacterium]